MTRPDKLSGAEIHAIVQEAVWCWAVVQHVGSDIAVLLVYANLEAASNSINGPWSRGLWLNTDDTMGDHPSHPLILENECRAQESVRHPALGL